VSPETTGLVVACHHRLLSRPRARSYPTAPDPTRISPSPCPGAVDAYLTVLETLGTKSLSDVLGPPPTTRARFPCTSHHRSLPFRRRRASSILYPPGGTDVFYPGGRVPRVGELFVQPPSGDAPAACRGRHARPRTPRAGIAAAREALLSRDIARHDRRVLRAHGRALRAGDLAGYRRDSRRRCAHTFAGREILGQSAWTQAPVLMQALGKCSSPRICAPWATTPARYIHGSRKRSARLRRSRALLRRRRRTGGAPNGRAPRPGLPARAGPLLRLDRAAPEQRARRSTAQGRRDARRPLSIPAKRRGRPAATATTHIAAVDREGNHDVPSSRAAASSGSRLCRRAGLARPATRARFSCSRRASQCPHPGPAAADDAGELSDQRGRRATMTIGCPGGDDSVQAKSPARPQRFCSSA